MEFNMKYGQLFSKSGLKHLKSEGYQNWKAFKNLANGKIQELEKCKEVRDAKGLQLSTEIFNFCLGVLSKNVADAKVSGWDYGHLRDWPGFYRVNMRVSFGAVPALRVCVNMHNEGGEIKVIPGSSISKRHGHEKRFFRLGGAPGIFSVERLEDAKNEISKLILSFIDAGGFARRVSGKQG